MRALVCAPASTSSAASVVTGAPHPTPPSNASTAARATFLLPARNVFPRLICSPQPEAPHSSLRSDGAYLPQPLRGSWPLRPDPQPLTQRFQDCGPWPPEASTANGLATGSVVRTMSELFSALGPF